MRKYFGMSFVILFVGSCTVQPTLDYALKSAKDNRPELEKVLEHYRNDEPQKYEAAKFLIRNLPAHYSYAGTDIYDYYDYAATILADTSLTPEQQRDSLLAMTDDKYSDLPNHIVPDAEIITADFLINTIDKSYEQWTTCPWASQVTYYEYLEWMLPYKGIEFQELDSWRDSILNYFNYGLTHPVINDIECNTTMGIADMLRNEALIKMNRYGLYTREGLPLLSDYLLPRQTFGDIPDYALLAVLLMRSAGIPSALDETPVGSRFTAAVRWFVIIDDKGKEQASEWDLSTTIGNSFFPYERGPKVYRISPAINSERWEYKQKAKYQYPFDLNKKDVTSHYFRTCDLEIPISSEVKKSIKDKYVYIASAVRSNDKPWQIVDFGRIKHGKACFHDMGREVLYMVFGYDGSDLVAITDPFILHKDCSIEYLSADTIQSPILNKWKNNSL